MKKRTTKHTHTFKTGEHITTIVLTEQPDRIVIEQYINHPDPDMDRAAFAAWLLPILLPYENDRRPQVWHNMQTGEACTIVDRR